MGGEGVVLRYEKVPEKAPKGSVRVVSEDAEVLSGLEETVSDGHYNASEEELKTEHFVPKMPNWEHKALSKATLQQKIEPFPIILTLSVGGMAVASTIGGMDARTQVATYIIAAIVFIVTNPLHSIERMLALPSRILVAIALAMVDVFISFPTKNVLLGVLVVISIVVLLVKIGNKKWLIRETYLATEFTRKAQKLDAEDLPYLSWRAHGKCELWTALEQAGLTITENELDLGYRIAWRHGYYIGMTMVKSRNKSINDLEEQIVELEEDLEQKEEALNKVQWWISNYKEAEEETEDIRNELRLALDEAQHYRAEVELHEARERKYNEQLKLLGKQVQELKETGSTAEAQEDMVKRMLEAGVSYRQIEAVTGINKYRIGEVKKKYGIELKDKAG